MKLVSVYINAYNAEKFILETVNSVLNQTYKNLQLIVVDDGSTDKTAEVLASLKDERLEVYTVSPNRHISNALNTALLHVKGDYVAHTDADDPWAPDKLEKQLAYLEENKDCEMCVTHVRMIDADGNDADEQYAATKSVFEIEDMSQAKMFRYLYDEANHISHCSFLATKALMDKVGPYDLTLPLLHDFDLWMKALCHTRIGVLEEPLTCYRMVENSNSKMNLGKWNSHDTEYERLMERAINRLPDDVFLEAFADKLKLQGDHTPQEIELEKAFVMIDAVLPLLPNSHLAVNKFVQLFQDKEYIELAETKFGFTLHDFYQLQRLPSLHNSKKFGQERFFELENRVDDLLQQNENLIEQHNQTVLELKEERENLQEQIHAKNEAIGQLTEENHRLSSNYIEIANSFFWRLTGPARRIMQRIKNFLSRHPRLLAICIFLKCLLREGYFPAKQKYRAFLPKANQKTLFEISAAKRKQQESTKFSKKLKISVLVPLYNTPEKFLVEMIESVQNQTFKNWELCLADGSDEEHDYVGAVCRKLAEKDKRIVYKKLDENKGISENTNACIEISSGNYIGLFDHDDLLHPSVLFEVANAIENQNADMVYTDEVTFQGAVSNIVNFAFKPDYSPDTLRSYNYICHFTTFSRELMEKAGGGFQARFDGSQDYDLILRLTEKAEKIVHVAKPLYFWRSHEQSTASSISAKPYIINAAHKALAEHLERVGLKGTVEDGAAPSVYRINYDIIGEPLISIIIPNKDHTDDLDKCLQSVFEKSTYKNYEILIVENNSTEPETFAYYEKIQQHEKVKILYWEREFNYSAINNFGVKEANGDYILLLNNDVEILSENWLQEMLMYAQREDVGAVGVKLYYPDDTIQHAGVIIGLGGVAGHSHKYFPKEDPGFMRRITLVQNLSACTAACLMIPRKVYDEVGGLEEGYAVAFNDVDLCMKIREAGYLIVYTPYAELYHYESKSRGFEDSPEKVARFQSEINRFRSRWSKELEAGDPYYNPNLTLNREDFGVEIREQ